MTAPEIDKYLAKGGDGHVVFKRVFFVILYCLKILLADVQPEKIRLQMLLNEVFVLLISAEPCRWFL
jgi:hypothetical protein